MRDLSLKPTSTGAAPMSLFARKGLLAIAAVIDVALHSKSGPVSAKALAAHHGLPPRYLEPVLQALVRNGILESIRGPRGGYEMITDQGAVTIEAVLAAANSAEEGDELAHESALIAGVVRPALENAGESFSAALRQITVADVVELAERSASQSKRR